jgi:hypothetical protein
MSATYTQADELGVRLLALHTGLSREDCRVMWAGPALLDACKMALDDLKTEMVWGPVRDALTAAIEKAEGPQ